jgi:hypothetical protein
VNDKEALSAGYKGDWHPLTDLNQCFMVVDRMRELGWYLSMKDYGGPDLTEYGFQFWKTGDRKKYYFNPNPAKAILTATWAALEGGK